MMLSHSETAQENVFCIKGTFHLGPDAKQLMWQILQPILKRLFNIFLSFILAFTTARNDNYLKRSLGRGLKNKKEMAVHKNTMKVPEMGSCRCHKHQHSLALAPPLNHIAICLWLWNVAVLGMLFHDFSPKSEILIIQRLLLHLALTKYVPLLCREPMLHRGVLACCLLWWL